MYDLEIYNKAIAPKLSSVAALRQSLKKALGITKLDDKRIACMLLCITEWLNNIILHSSQLPSTIHITAFSRDNFLTIKIMDDAPPFKNFAHYIASADIVKSKDIESISEGGYGFYIIKHYFPDVLYHQINKESSRYNEFILQQRLCNTDRKDISIAIIEDEVTVANILQAYLDKIYHVETYFKVEDFLFAIKRKQFSLIISDINFPGMSGIELREQLARKKETDIIPFLFLTASEEKGLEEQAGNLGIDDFLHKPVAKQQLLDVVHRIIQRKSSERSVLGDLLSEKITTILRPKLPKEIAACQCQAAYRNASAGGGDFIVFIAQGDESVIFLCDVMGHGTEAKFFAHAYAGYLHGLIRASAQELNIAAIMQKLSSLIMQDDALGSVIMTSLAVHLDKSKPGLLQIINAGHPEPWLVSPEEVRVINVGGVLLGIDQAACYETYTINLQSDERLFLFTDGFYEIGSQAEKHEQIRQRMMDFLQTHHTMPVAQLTDKLMDAFDAYAGIPPQDDATVLLFGRA